MLSILSPKVPCYHIESGTILSIGGPVLKLLPGHGLYAWFHTNTMTDLTQLIRSAVMLRISLWRIEGKPPLAQLSACSMEKRCPQTQLEGRLPTILSQAQGIPKRSFMYSANPCSEMGSTESQLEAPFSEQMVRAFCSLVGRSSFRSVAVLASYCLWNFQALFLILV